MPTIVDVTGACENVNTLLSVSGVAGASSAAVPKFLTQTGQLALERMLVNCAACWCVTGSFRNDASDSRHLQEFDLVEEEFSAGLVGALDEQELFDALLQRVTDVVHAAVSEVDVSSLRQYVPSIDHMDALMTGEFPRFRYGEALEVANAARRRESTPDLSWGDDLRPADEGSLLQHAAGGGPPVPVFVTHFPEELKFFNMKVDPWDETTVLSADLLLPFAGEAVGAAVREDNYASLHARLERSSMLRMLKESGHGDATSFESYLELIRLGLTPLHAGYGLGLERMLQSVCAAADIRDVSVPWRLTEPDPSAIRDRGERVAQ